MGTIWRDMSWEFDGDRLNLDVREWKHDNQVTWAEFAELTGHYEPFTSLGVIGKNWIPSMDGFLAVCNLCELNPLAYFVLVDYRLNDRS